MYPINPFDFLRSFFRKSAGDGALEAKPAARRNYAHQYHLLCDFATHIVLAAGTNIAAVMVLRESIPDSYQVSDAQYPNHLVEFPLSDTRTGSCAEWTWRSGRRLSRTNPSVLTNLYVERSKLASTKLRAFEEIMRSLNVARHPVRRGVDFQETVYLVKKAEAKAFKKSGYDESDLLLYPYVLQYADLAGISMKEAADEILFKAKLDEQFLLRTEGLRLKFFRKIKDEKDAEKIADILEEYRQERYKRAFV